MEKTNKLTRQQILTRPRWTLKRVQELLQPVETVNQPGRGRPSLVYSTASVEAIEATDTFKLLPEKRKYTKRTTSTPTCVCQTSDTTAVATASNDQSKYYLSPAESTSVALHLVV
jgi:hypothetical protein